MRVVVLLADSAQVDASGRLHALGMGATVLPTPTPPMAVVLRFETPWTEANRRHDFKVELRTADGHPFVPEEGMDAPGFEGQFEMGRPAGTPPGTPLVQHLAATMGPGLPLISGQRYEWRAWVDGRTHEDWVAAFMALDPSTLR